MKTKTKKIIGGTALALALVTAVGGIAYGVRANEKGLDETNNDILMRETSVYLELNGSKKMYFKEYKGDLEELAFLTLDPSMTSITEASVPGTYATLETFKTAVKQDFRSKFVNDEAFYKTNIVYELKNIHLKSNDSLKMKFLKDINNSFCLDPVDCNSKICDWLIGGDTLDSYFVLDDFNECYRVNPSYSGTYADSSSGKYSFYFIESKDYLNDGYKNGSSSFYYTFTPDKLYTAPESSVAK